MPGVKKAGARKKSRRVLRKGYKRVRSGSTVYYVSAKTGNRVLKSRATVSMKHLVRAACAGGVCYVDSRTGRQVTAPKHRAGRSYHYRTAKTKAYRRMARKH